MDKYKVGDRVYHHGEKMEILRIGLLIYHCLDTDNRVRHVLIGCVKPIITVKA